MSEPEIHDPLYGDVIVRWSEMTPEEQERARRDYEKAVGADKETK
ncbi:hypothetical protein QIH77_03275 [Bradyrhizobium diazoefficiens]|nr:hypothetical protein [Bradyrhizobium diazoefficiens]WLA74269.1 hypothetical protein QIH77_03275 [Bradyrhizobium diazoefficiens]